MNGLGVCTKCKLGLAAPLLVVYRSTCALAPIMIIDHALLNAYNNSMAYNNDVNVMNLVSVVVRIDLLYMC